MDAPAGSTLVFVDASVLINFLHIDRSDLLGAMAEHRFVIPEEVGEEEILRSEQRARLQRALAAGHLGIETSTNLEEIALAAELRQFLDRGEAISLAMAQHRRGSIACDERGRFRSEARIRLGMSRILTTPDLLLIAIRQGLLDVREADHLKLFLERKSFRMRFASFADLL